MSTDLDWQHSPSSNPSGNCPQYADLPDGGKAIRNHSKPDAVVEFTQAEWTALRADIKSGLVV